MAHAVSGGKERQERGRLTPRGVETPKLLGLFELDAAGTVLYARFEADGAGGGTRAPDVPGRNFYTEVAPFENVGEFSQLVEAFRRGYAPARSMDFTCRYEDGPLPVRILLTRIRERSKQDATKSILVHVRRAQQ